MGEKPFLGDLAHLTNCVVSFDLFQKVEFIQKENVQPFQLYMTLTGIRAIQKIHIFSKTSFRITD